MIYYIFAALLFLLILALRLSVFFIGLYSKGVACKGIFDGFNSYAYRRILRENFIVFSLLDSKGEAEFENRVCNFLKEKKFLIADGIPSITDEMRLMIAAAAIQLTYGYPHNYLSRFENIILYADDYYSTSTGLLHEGEVNTMGAIVLSWKNLVHGFNLPHDGKNLLIHEMAHALFLSTVLSGDEYNSIEPVLLNELQQEAALEKEKSGYSDISFFREYAFTNLPEFFSVVLEMYFERTSDLKLYNPNLYALITKILKYDLLNFKH